MTTQSNPQAIPNAMSALRSFHPGWFGAVMGTAIVGVGAFMNPGNIAALQPLMRVVGIAFVALAYALVIVLGVPYVWRWVQHPDAARQDLRHPILGALYGTFPGGILVLAAATLIVGPSAFTAEAIFPPVAALAVIGIALTFVIGVVFAYILFVTPNVAPEQVNGGWFIPPVINIIVPLVLMPFVPRVDAEIARLLLVLSGAGWGIGFFSFLLIAALLYNRLVFHPLPAAPLAPSLWIGLGPVAVAGLALIRIAQDGAPVWGELSTSVNALAQFGAFAFWGFGLWWFAAAILLLRKYLRQGSLPFGVGWWAFTFPLGAYTVMTLTLARAWKVGALEVFGAALFLLLVVFWLVVTIRTLIGIRTGEAWKR